MELKQRYDISGKHIIVTGASKGIGAGVSELLADQGAHVYLVARSTDALGALCARIEDKGGRARVFYADLRDVSSIGACVSQIQEVCPQIDVLFNNAGMGNPIEALDVTERDWDEMMDLNLKGMFFFSQAVAALMAKTGGGKIINMSSQASIVAIPGETIYCASKAAVNQMTKNLALEWAPEKINVNAIGPTFVYTPGTAARLDDPEFRANVLKHIPLGRFGTMEDIAGAVTFLASSASDMITGAFLLIDGGWTIV